MSLPLQDRAQDGNSDALVRLTMAGLPELPPAVPVAPKKLIPERALKPGEQYRFHFNMNKCIGCRSCEIACNEQNGNPTEIRWRRIGEIEGGTYPDTSRHYLSMGCNHCLDAECLKGCPVEAYTKDPATGIVLHSANACIGCQYCVWNCPYSVPQFNAERGVVGKCDMCHGRLAEGLEPACVNACPEAAIEIEIVDMLEWLRLRARRVARHARGRPYHLHYAHHAAAKHLYKTRTRRYRPHSIGTRASVAGLYDHAHPGRNRLAQLCSLFPCSSAYVAARFVRHHRARPQHLCVSSGQAAYAWRALKMWRRSWLSREVLLFGLFFGALTFLSATTCTAALPPIWLVRLHATAIEPFRQLPSTALAIEGLGVITAILGICGIVASAFIYLVPARPSWNMLHTPVDFLLSAALIGTVLPSLIGPKVHDAGSDRPILWPCLFAALVWTANQGVRCIRLHRSGIFEHRASAALLNLPRQRTCLIASFLLAGAVPLFSWAGGTAIACVAAFGAVLLTRYLFFVSVVPLNMALTFTRGGTH